MMKTDMSGKEVLRFDFTGTLTKMEECVESILADASKMNDVLQDLPVDKLDEMEAKETDPT